MEQFLEILGTIVGLIYLWQEYHAGIYLWITSIIMPAIYLFVYYKAGLYADFGINIYYLIISVYGWMSWKYGFDIFNGRNNATPKKTSITYTPLRSAIMLATAFSAVLIIITLLLLNYTDSNVPFLDSFTTSLSIVGMYMLAKKYIEQWWIWFVTDVVSVGLYIYKELYFTSALYALYAIIAIYGYAKWKRIMKEEQLNIS